jgi:hypothetical protein
VDREAAQNSIARLYTALVAGIDEVEAQIPRVGTDRRATDFVDHEQAVAGKEAHALAQRAIALARRWFFGSLNDQNDT